MNEQIEMTLPEPKNNRFRQEDIEQVLHWLEQADDWMSSHELLQWLGWPVTDANKRKLRAIADATHGKIASAPGSPGFILTKNMRAADLRLIESLRSQADRMRERYISINRVWHAANVDER